MSRKFTTDIVHAVAAVLTVVVTAAILWVYWQQANIMERQLQATEKAALASLGANEFASMGLRAWLAPRKLSYKGKFDEPAGQFSEVSLLYENM